MKYFKHQATMRHDRKIRRLINRYGLEGYGLYNLILESIVEGLETGSPLPELKDSAEDIAEFYNANQKRVEEIVSFMVSESLFEIDSVSKRVSCLRIYKYLESGSTRSEDLKKMIGSYKDAQRLRLSQTVSDKSRHVQDKSRLFGENLPEPEQNQNRIEPEEIASEVFDEPESPINPTPDDFKLDTEPKPEPDTFNANSPEAILATLLLTEHRKSDEAFLVGKDEANIKRWSADIEKLMRIDKRSFEDVRRVILWCQRPGSFWCSNILSGSKLREQFSTLLLQCNRERDKIHDDPNPRAAEMARIITATDDDEAERVDPELAEQLLREAMGPRVVAQGVRE